MSKFNQDVFASSFNQEVQCPYCGKIVKLVIDLAPYRKRILIDCVAKTDNEPDGCEKDFIVSYQSNVQFKITAQKIEGEENEHLN